jgi:hypothetical protein
MIMAMRALVIMIAFSLGPAGCSDEKDVAMCVALSGERILAPEGDNLCVDRENCSSTTGTPDHQGCPNTCSCLCHEGRCYQQGCTAIACNDPPVYR